MHTDPVAHAAQHFDRVDSYQEAMEREVSRLHKEFINSAMTKTLTDKAGFGSTTVWNGSVGVKVDATVLDVMVDAMDYKSNDSVIFAALVACAKKGDMDALAAIDKLGYTYADIHAEVDA